MFKEKFSKIEDSLLVWLSAVYAVLSVIAEIFKIEQLQKLYTNPEFFVPAISFFLFLVSRYIISLGGSLSQLKKLDKLVDVYSEEDIKQTHQSSLFLAKNSKTSFYATYLHPEAFADEEVIKDIQAYWKEVESLELPDYKRIFGIYPDKPEYLEYRNKTFKWLEEHKKRTEKLKGYQFRYIEVGAHVVDIAISDSVAHYAFPFTKYQEHGFTMKKSEDISIIRRYFLELWDKAKRLEDISSKSQA